MLQIVIWGLAAGVALVGLNILQLALTSSLPKKGAQIAFGFVTALFAIVFAIALVVLGDEQVSNLGDFRTENTVTTTPIPAAPDNRDWREQLRASDAAIAGAAAKRAQGRVPRAPK